MWIFHTSTNTWEEVAMVGQIPPPRSYHVMTSPPNSPYLYLFGGCKPVKGRYNDLWRFDLRSKVRTNTHLSVHEILVLEHLIIDHSRATHILFEHYTNDISFRRGKSCVRLIRLRSAVVRNWSRLPTRCLSCLASVAESSETCISTT